MYVCAHGTDLSRLYMRLEYTHFTPPFFFIPKCCKQMFKDAIPFCLVQPVTKESECSLKYAARRPAIHHKAARQRRGSCHYPGAPIQCRTNNICVVSTLLGRPNKYRPPHTSKAKSAGHVKSNHSLPMPSSYPSVLEMPSLSFEACSAFSFRPDHFW